MKNSFRYTIALALVATLALQLSGHLTASTSTAAIGGTAPDFTLTDTRGKQFTLSELKGKYVVLEWLNHDCPFVLKHYKSGNMQSLQKKYGEKGVVWLAVVSSAPGKQGHYPNEEHDAIMTKKGAAPAAVLIDADGKVGKVYGARTTPHMFVIDPEQTLIYNGAIDDRRSTDVDDIEGARNHVAAALDEAMSGKPVSIPTSQPYGCSVKY